MTTIDPHNFLDIRLGYPEMTPIHAPLHALLPELYKQATSTSEITRKADIALLQKFFGMGEEAVPYASAGAAIGEVLDNLTEPGDAVIVFPPHWHEYPKLIQDSGSGNRNVISLHTDDPGEFEDAIKKSEHPVKAALLNVPRNPDLYILDENTLRAIIEIADRHHITIVFDEVLAFYSPDGKVERVGNENRLALEMPRAYSSVIIRDTAKLFPCPPFPKMAMADFSEGALEAGIDKLKKKHWNRHFADGNLDLRVFCDLLSHELFLPFIEDLKKIAAENFSLLQTALKELSVEVQHGGPFAMVHVDAVEEEDRYGWDIVNSVEMGNPEHIKPFVRVPIVKDPAKFAEIVNQMKEKIISSS